MKVSELQMAPNAYYNSLVCNKQVNYISQPFPKVKPKPRRGFQMNDNVDKLYDLLARNHTKNREPPIISQEKGKKLIVPEFLSIILDFSEQLPIIQVAPTAKVQVLSDSRNEVDFLDYDRRKDVHVDRNNFTFSVRRSFPIDIQKFFVTSGLK